jgi:hypothetical protein
MEVNGGSSCLGFAGTGYTMYATLDALGGTLQFGLVKASQERWRLLTATATRLPNPCLGTWSISWTTLAGGCTYGSTQVGFFGSGGTPSITGS